MNKITNFYFAEKINCLLRSTSSIYRTSYMRYE